MGINPTRRKVITALGASVPVLLFSRTSRAKLAYPTRTVRIIDAWPPGSSTDFTVRLLAHELGKATGHDFIVENRPGATGIVGAGVVAKEPPNGYTLLFTTASLGSNKLVYGHLPYDPFTAFAPISMVGTNILSIVVNPSLPVHSLAELIQYAKAHPGVLSYGTPGLGSPHHLAGALLARRAGFKWVHIPYKGGGPSIRALLGGQIQAAVASVVAVSQFIHSGQLRMLAVTGKQRYEALPNVPTVAETFPGFNVSGWGAVFAPRGTPAPIVDYLNAQIVKILHKPDVRKTLAARGVIASPSTPQGLAQEMRDEYKQWATIMKSGIKLK